MQPTNPNSKTDHPFEVPEAYFEQLGGRVDNRVRLSSNLDTQAGLLPIDQVFRVPVHYFDTILSRVQQRLAKKSDTLIWRPSFGVQVLMHTCIAASILILIGMVLLLKPSPTNVLIGVNSHVEAAEYLSHDAITMSAIDDELGTIEVNHVANELNINFGTTPPAARILMPELQPKNTASEGQVHNYIDSQSTNK